MTLHKLCCRESQINSDESVSSQSSVGGGLYHSHSNPDLSTTGTYEDVRTEFPEHVLKVSVQRLSFNCPFINPFGCDRHALALSV